MKTMIIIFAIILGTVLSTVVPRVGPIHSHVPLVYRIDLQDPPQKRWAPLIRDFQQPLKKFMYYFDLLPIPQKFFHQVQWYAKNIYQQHQFVNQVQAIAKLSGFPFDRLFFLNFMYQFSTFKACTGVLMRTAQGKVIHGRNLDFEMWQIIAKMIANVQYYKGGKKLFSIDTVVGSVFALTGIRHGSFAINVDTRTAQHFYTDLISIMIDDALPTCWLLRKVLEQQTTYAGAVKRLKSQRIGGPVYYIVSGTGPNDGIVIQRQVNSVHASYQLSDQTWFLVQTNYDRDQPDPLDDQRRIPVQKKMIARGNTKFTQQTLMNEFMSLWPTFNIATIMTSIIVPAQGYHNTTVWYGQNPVHSEVQ